MFVLVGLTRSKSDAYFKDSPAAVNLFVNLQAITLV